MDLILTMKIIFIGEDTAFNLFWMADFTETAEVETVYTQDGPEAQRIASVIPYYPFHGEFNWFESLLLLGL